MRHLTGIEDSLTAPFARVRCSCGWIGPGGQDRKEARQSAFRHLGAVAQTEHRDEYIPPALNDQEKQEIIDVLGFLPTSVT